MKCIKCGMEPMNGIQTLFGEFICNLCIKPRIEELKLSKLKL